MDTGTTHADYPVLRLLATGTRSHVWLLEGDRVLKVLDSPIAPGAPAAEAEALHRARGEHVVELLDASGDDDRFALVFPRLGRGSLADVLAARDAVDAGEAVTALVPVAAALGRMHAAGVAHGSLEPGAVLFTADGAPMLTGFGGAELFEPGLPAVRREQLEAVQADRAALVAMARAVLLRVQGPRAAAARELAERLRDAPPIDLESELARELFGLAAARPVVLDPIRGTTERPGRLVATDVAAEPEALPTAPRIPALLADLLGAGPVSTARRVLLHRWSALDPARRRLVLGLGAAALAILVLVALIPGPEPAADPIAADPLAADPFASTPAADALPDDGVLQSDDPLAALTELLRLREQCLRDLSVLCLAEVDLDGSSASQQDRAWLQDVIDSGAAAPELSAEGAAVSERLGGSVLIALAPDSDPASVLMMRAEAGWRIRDYLTALPDA